MKLMRVLRAGCVAVALVAAAACNNSTTAPSGAAYSATDLRVGTGTAVAAGSTVSVTYTGWLYDPTKTDNKGLVFDTNLGADKPFQFTIGSGTVIAGWDQGIPGMKIGGIRRLVIPPSLGYGGTRAGSVPPYSTLIFEVTLVSVP